eukprot:SAG31_NODE_10_length_40133_cov_27.863041_19_plen_73_part_00
MALKTGDAVLLPEYGGQVVKVRAEAELPPTSLCTRCAPRAAALHSTRAEPAERGRGSAKSAAGSRSPFSLPH